MRVDCIGRLGKDPDFSYTPDGIPMCRFSLAVDAGKDRDGKKRTDWWDFIWTVMGGLIGLIIHLS